MQEYICKLPTLDLIDSVVELFTKEELKLLEIEKSSKKTLSFKDQLISLYLDHYPIDAPWEEIKQTLETKINIFRKNLNQESISLIREELFHIFSKNVFITRKSKILNLEMQKNVHLLPDNEINKSTKWAIKKIVKKIYPEVLSKLEIITEDSQLFSFRDQLYARYRNFFLDDSRSFHRYIDRGNIHNSFWSTIEELKKKKITDMDKQKFLIEIDSFFKQVPDDFDEACAIVATRILYPWLIERYYPISCMKRKFERSSTAFCESGYRWSSKQKALMVVSFFAFILLINLLLYFSISNQK